MSNFKKLTLLYFTMFLFQKSKTIYTVEDFILYPQNGSLKTIFYLYNREHPYNGSQKHYYYYYTFWKTSWFSARGMFRECSPTAGGMFPECSPTDKGAILILQHKPSEFNFVSMLLTPIIIPNKHINTIISTSIFIIYIFLFIPFTFSTIATRSSTHNVISIIAYSKHLWYIRFFSIY